MNPEVKQQLIKIFSILFALFLTLVIALGFKFYYAFSTNEPAIAQNYYEVGKDYDRYINSKKSSDNRQLTSLPDISEIKRGINQIKFQYMETSDHSSTGIKNGKIQITLTRRATLKGQILKECITDHKGECSIHFEIPASGGRYEISLHANDKDGRFTTKEMIEI
ncbi:MAG: FixH family protein [Spirochaetia bacterium]|nr:FixH family protein [Spirochaetia bacterium]